MGMVKILLIDDDIHSREGIAARLCEVEGYGVRAFADGKPALAHLEKHWEQYTAVLLDYVLDPSMPGERVLEVLRTRFPSLPTIVFTGQAPSGGARALAEGAYASLQRPLDFMELKKILDDLAELEKAFQDIARDSRGLLESDVCLAWRLDRKNRKFKVAGWAGYIDKNYLEQATIEDTGSWSARYREGEPVFISDVKDAGLAPHYQFREEAVKLGWASLLSVPLIQDGRITGLIDNYSKKPNFFLRRPGIEESRVRKMLKAFARQAAEGIRYLSVKQNNRAVQEISQSLANTTDEEIILQTILVKALGLVGADYGWIYMLGRQTDKLELRAFLGIERENLETSRMPGEGITGWVAKEGVARYIPDVKEMGERPEMIEHRPTPGADVRSEIAVPFRQGERTIGVLTVKSRFPQHFTSDDLDLLIGLAAIATVVIKGTNLTYHIQELSKLALRSADFKELADYVVGAVWGLTGADVNLWMMSNREEEGDRWLRIVANKSSVDEDYLENRLPAGAGSCINAHALHERRPIIKRDLVNDTEEPHFYLIDAARKYSWRSFMAVPLLGRDGERIGVLSLYSSTVGKFSRRDAAFIQTFADQAAIAFQQQKRVTAMQQLAEINEKLAVEFENTKQLLKQIVEIAADITKADCAVLYPYDPVKRSFYQKEAIVSAGLLNTEKDYADKARKEGLTALVRKYRMIIVDDVEMGLARVGFHAITDEEGNTIIERVREAKFIKRESIKAFIGISLFASERYENQEPDEQEVGVLYINFRAPHHFSSLDIQSVSIYANQVAALIRKNQLYVEAQRQKKELEAIHQSALDIVGQQDLNSRLRKIVEAARTLLKGKGGAIYLPVQGQQKLKLEAVVGIEEEALPLGMAINFGEGLSGYIFQSGRAKILDDYSRWEGRIDSLAPYFSAIIGVPLLRAEKVIGVLVVFSGMEKKRFSKEDQGVLERLGQQAALAIHNAQLYKELDALYNTGLNIASQRDLKEAGNIILRELGNVMEYHKATIQLIHPDRSRELLSFRGFDKNDINLELLGPVNKDKLIRHVVQSGKPIILSNARGSRLWDKEIAQTRDVESWAGVPLMFQNETVGLMTLDHRQPGFYQEKDEKLLTLFANQAASAINNARLNEDLIKRARQLEKLHDAGIRASTIQVRSEDGLNSVLQFIAETVVELFEADSATIIPFNSSINKFEEGIRAGWGKEKIRPPGPEGASSEIIKKRKATFKNKKGSAKESPVIIHGKISYARANIPLIFDHNPVGVLFINYFKDHIFSENERTLFRLFGQQAAVAIQNALTQVIQRRQKISAFYRELNPYTVGPPISDPQKFFGRETIIQQILNGIHNNHYIVFGERRIGKTSLLHQIRFHLEFPSQEDKVYVFFPIYANLQGRLAEDFFHFLMGQIADSLSKPGELKLRYRNGLPYNDQDFEDDLEVILDHLRTQYPGRIIRIVLLLDEMDQFVKYGQGLHNRFRGIFQTPTGGQLKMVMSGVNIQRVRRAQTSPWYNMMNEIEIRPLSVDSARRLVIEPVLGYYKYDEDALEAILTFSDLKPQEIQWLCSKAVDNMLNRVKYEIQKTEREVIPEKDLAISIDDVSAAFRNALEEKSSEFSDQWKQFDPGQKQFLLEKASLEGEMELKGYEQHFTKEELYNLTSSSEENQLRLTYLFQQWLKRLNE